MTQLENIPMQEENVNITLSIPISELAGLVPVDYKTITEKVINEIDMDDLASNVKDSLDMEDLASDVKDYIDMDDLASDVRSNMDIESVEDKVTNMLEQYDVLNGCETAKLATEVIIEAIRYDIMTHLYGSDKSKMNVTMTDTLRRFIQQEIARQRDTYTFDQIDSVLNSIPELDFDTKFKIKSALTVMRYNEKMANKDVIIKAD